MQIAAAWHGIRNSNVQLSQRRCLMESLIQLSRSRQNTSPRRKIEQLHRRVWMLIRQMSTANLNNDVTVVCCRNWRSAFLQTTLISIAGGRVR